MGVTVGNFILIALAIQARADFKELYQKIYNIISTNLPAGQVLISTSAKFHPWG